MLQLLIHRLLARRHFWRHATFGEVAELYASRLMRIFALRLVTVFTSIYLLQLGFPLVFIAFFWVAFYAMKSVSSWPAALMVARLGPKHATLVSNFVSAASMALLPLSAQPRVGLLALVAWCALHAYSGALNDIAYLVDFSKVKHAAHAGKELGFMNIVEKMATGLSPFIGGAIAFILGPQSIMVLSAVLFLLSAVPLLATAEPTPTHIKLRFRGFPWRTTWRSMMAQGGVGVDVFTTTTVWSIFLAIVVFGFSSNRIYAEIGLVTSITLLVTILISYTFGRMIDGQKGGTLLRIGTIVNSLIHLLRIFVRTPFEAIATNIANEFSTAGYSMPFMRGMFDTADYSGRRIEYMFLMEVAMNIGGLLAALALALLVVVFNPVDSLQLFFAVGAIGTLLIMTPRFALYKK